MDKSEIMLVICISMIASILMTVVTVLLIVPSFNDIIPLTLKAEPTNVTSVYYMTREVADTFNKNLKDVEFNACLDVSLNITYNENKTMMYRKFIIDKITSDIKHYGTNYAGAITCKKGKIHSHTSGECKFSDVDVNTFHSQIEDGLFFDVIMCDLDTFIYQSRENFREKIIQIIEEEN